MSRQPNILFILPDQLRPDYLSCYGAEFVSTPNIDGLASAGRRWETAISPVPACVPARASMLTGQHAHASGVMHNMLWLRPDRRDCGIMTWPEHLSQAGYRTAAIGKMHFYPWDLSEGFQHRIIAEDKRHIDIEDDYAIALRQAGYHKPHGTEQRGYNEWKGACFWDLPEELHVDRWVGRQAVDYLHSLKGDQPFALMVGFPGPHCQYDPPEAALDAIEASRIPPATPPTGESLTHRAAFVAGYKRDWAKLDYATLTAAEIHRIRHHYAASVKRIDEDVGAILSALEASGRLDNTIVIFASDHGDYLGDFGMLGKGTFHEPSIRVPLIVTDFRAPGAQVEAEPVSLLDLYPSILEWAGVQVPNNADGLSLDASTPDRVIVGFSNVGGMARNSDWKLVRYANGAQALFDLRNDPYEQINLLDNRAAERQALDAAMTRVLFEGLQKANWDKQVPAVKAFPPHPFYHREWQRPYPHPLTSTESGLR